MSKRQKLRQFWQTCLWTRKINTVSLETSLCKLSSETPLKYLWLPPFMQIKAVSTFFIISFSSKELYLKKNRAAIETTFHNDILRNSLSRRSAIQVCDRSTSKLSQAKEAEIGNYKYIARNWQLLHTSLNIAGSSDVKVLWKKTCLSKLEMGQIFIFASQYGWKLSRILIRFRICYMKRTETFSPDMN